jgi:hypothetical protein
VIELISSHNKLTCFLFKVQDEPKIQLFSQRKKLKVWLLHLKAVIHDDDENSQDKQMFHFMMITGQSSFKETLGFFKVFVCWRFKFCHIIFNSTGYIDVYLLLITIET